MKAIVYYISLPFIYIIALLPYRLLYLVSDIVFILLFYVFRYRREVVFNNLRNSFPGKNSDELKKTEKDFFRYLSDLIFETFKNLTISKSDALKRCRTVNMDLVEQFTSKGRSVVIVLGHYGNWELAGNAYSLSAKHQLHVIYRKLANPYFDRLMFYIRSRLGTKLIEAQSTYPSMLNLRGQITATGFIADQTPHPENAYWTTFLHQETPVFWGTEVIARKLNYPVIYAHVDRIKRGYYELSFELLTAEPSKSNEGDITSLHTKRLEADIIKKPEIWLWSHRRWKHKRPQNQPLRD